MPRQSVPEGSPLVVSYLDLRKAVGIIGLALPFVLAIGNILLHGLRIENSISSYYYTEMRNIFVGSLCAIAVFLMSYRGYDHRDLRAGRFAFVCAIAVAFIPTKPLPVATPEQELIGAVHLAFAALLFLTLAYFSIKLFTETDPHKTPTRRKLQRNAVYRVSGYIILACIGLIAVAALPPVKAVVDWLEPRFWLESIAIVAFGVSWLIKGETILKDQEDQREQPQRLAAGVR